MGEEGQTYVPPAYAAILALRVESAQVHLGNLYSILVQCYLLLPLGNLDDQPSALRHLILPLGGATVVCSLSRTSATFGICALSS